MGVGPSTKETTLHHFQDPLLEVISQDQDFDLLGIILVGTPQSQTEKYFVGERTAILLKNIGVEGVLFSVDGWGNSHIDYENTFRELVDRNIPVVGLSFIGTQADFVVKNKALETIVDINKSTQGIETQVLGENTLTRLDAQKAAAFLKLKMRGKS